MADAKPVVPPTNAPLPTPSSNAPSTTASGRSGREGRSRSGGPGFGGTRSGGPGRAERSGPKTVYLAEKKIVNGESVIEPKPVEIRTGITDGISTEIISGMKEGDEVITGIVQPEAESARPASNPFSGGRRRFGG
jgi:hypothetical protein